MVKILFVDDEPNVLEGLQRLLRGMRTEWEMDFAPSGAVALQLLASKPFDVIVSDMRMPVLNGAQLLGRVKTLHPALIRIILSGHADADEIIKTVGVTHQFLAKPCDPAVLKQAILRASALRSLLKDETLRTSVAQFGRLPSLPSLYLELRKELDSPGASFGSVARIVSRDIAMTAKVLQLVNSAFFGLPRPVQSMSEAVSLLGLSTLQSLALSAQAFSEFDLSGFPGVPLRTLWDHSIAVSLGARRIAELHGAGDLMRGQSFMAGLLHELGTLVLASASPKTYQTVILMARLEQLPRHIAEKRLFGCSHAEAGAYLAGLWGLPDPIVEALAYQHRPEACVNRVFSPLTAVHVADSLAEDPKWDGIPGDTISMEYLDGLGVAAHLPVWREACGSLEPHAETR